ncbi:MAG: branched-chain amino acid aminotransferase [Bacillota bacterium]|nr:branched-chain amino acid aminotransferase [Bacillota bacterium]
MLPISKNLAATLKEKPKDESKLGFGAIFTDHMFMCDYETEKGWHNARIAPYAPLQLDPACAVLHYSQSVFEGLKCYRREDGGLQLFRVKDNFKRMNHSALRLGMPELDIESFTQGLIELLRVEQDWVPHQPGTSLYIRPTLIATDSKLSVHASHSYLFYIILSPVGAYYKGGLAPNDIYIEDEYVRAVRGGIGETKAGANYAASLLAGIVAGDKGYAQVLWLDGVERRYIEEVGAMNILFVYEGKKVVTPKLSGSILPGITRDSVLKLAKHFGYEVAEERMDVNQVLDDIKSGKITESFGSGTAAVISPVKSFAFKGKDYQVGDGGIGPISQKLYDTLTGIQYGRLEDPMGWIVKV